MYNKITWHGKASKRTNGFEGRNLNVLCGGKISTKEKHFKRRVKR